MFGVGFLQGALKTKNKAFTNPEDAKSFAQTEAVLQDHPDVERANKIYRNDLENIPIFLFLALCYVMLNCWEKGALIYFSAFTFSRILHSIFYFKSIQPARSIAFFLGSIACVAISIHILLKVF